LKDYLRVGQAAKFLGISSSTVRLWCQNGKLNYHVSITGEKIFYPTELEDFKRAMLGLAPDSGKTFFYVRSSSDSDVLISTQMDKLKAAYGEPDKVFQDKSSGLNEKRRGLKTLLQAVKSEEGKVKVYVTNKDRLTRFGFNYLEELLATYGAEVIVLNSTETREPHEVLMEDFMALLASFSGKFYRLRGWEQQRKLIDNVAKKLETK
jgi:putative resolvase